MCKNISFLLLAITAVVHIAFGLIYVLADQFMGYHAVALSTNWEDLSPSYQVLILALMRLAGAAGLIAGLVNITLLFYFFRKEYLPIIWLAPVSAVIFQFFTNYVVYQVYTKTPGSPPLFWVSFGSSILIVALVFFTRWMKDQHLTKKSKGQ
ncbi:MAG: hypothetical protein ACR2QW_00215 [bacterium]